MKHQLESITPELAKRYLETNLNNRPFDQHYAARLADVMKAGLWKINGEVIRFDLAGNLFDGQHRLHAIIKSGVTIQTYVMRGMDAACVHTVDGDRKLRSVSDMLHFSGLTHCREISVMVRKIWRINALCAGTPTKCKITNSQADDFVKTHERSLYRALESVLPTSPLFSRESLAAWLFLFGQSDKAAVFIEGFQFGRNLSDTSPILLLRNSLIANRSAHRKLQTDAKDAMTIKAWNAFVLGETPKLLKFVKGEKFPTICIG